MRRWSYSRVSCMPRSEFQMRVLSLWVTVEAQVESELMHSKVSEVQGGKCQVMRQIRASQSPIAYPFPLRTPC